VFLSDQARGKQEDKSRNLECTHHFLTFDSRQPILALRITFSAFLGIDSLIKHRLPSSPGISIGGIAP
jgi:hypothetical protein